jgi:hypothetical protein
VNFTHHGWSYGKVCKGWQKKNNLILPFLTNRNVEIESAFNSNFLMDLRIKRRIGPLARFQGERKSLKFFKAGFLCRF